MLISSGFIISLSVRRANAVGADRFGLRRTKIIVLKLYGNWEFLQSNSVRQGKQEIMGEVRLPGAGGRYLEVLWTV